MPARTCRGYEIHTGRTDVQGAPFCTLADGTPEGCVQGNVFGTYLHGLFDTGELTEQLAAFFAAARGIYPAAAALISMQEYRPSSSTCWPMACAAWIWTPCMPLWALHSPPKGEMTNDAAAPPARRY